MISGVFLVVVPTYNERESLPQITTRIRASVPSAHILIADDNSPDGTGAIADSLAAADDQIHVMHRASKAGTRSGLHRRGSRGDSNTNSMFSSKWMPTVRINLSKLHRLLDALVEWPTWCLDRAGWTRWWNAELVEGRERFCPRAETPTHD